MQPYSIDLRKKIIEVRQQENISIIKLAERFKVAKSFVQKLLKRFEETGDISPLAQGESPPTKLNSEQLVTLVEIIEENNDTTLKELTELLKSKTEIRVSRSTMGRISNQLNYTLKKTVYPAEKRRERVQKTRVEFWNKIRKNRAQDLIFIDESGINLAMVRLYGRALKGQRARGKQPLKRVTNISLISAWSSAEVVASRNIYGAVSGITFEAFILNKLVSKLWKVACVVMDNAKIHCAEIVKKFIEEAGAKLIYLSPYSPEFSPIENFWSKVTSILRKLKTRNYLDLIDAITDAMLQVTKKDIHNWFAHCCYCTS